MGCQTLVIKFLGGSFESIIGNFQTHGVSLAGIDRQAGRILELRCLEINETITEITDTPQ